MFQAEDLKAAVIKKSPAFKIFKFSQSTQDQYSPYLHICFCNDAFWATHPSSIQFLWFRINSEL